MNNKKILIIGGSGSLGNILTKYLHINNTVFIFSRDENKQYEMKMKYPNVDFIISDMRNYSSVEKALININPNIVIIAAAMKHIDIAEKNIWECIQTNILGIQNIIEATQKLNLSDLESVLFISTDKACSPINVYGMCKSIGERLVTAAKKDNVKFVCCRYGNVLNSRGSLIPKFKELSKTNTPYFPITDLRMTRFFMTLDQSFKLIMTALKYGESGDIWIPQINAFNIIDIAMYFSKIENKTIKVVGIRSGEKLHECLITDHELCHTKRVEIDQEKYMIIKKDETFTDITEEYTSERTENFDLIKPLIEKIIEEY